MNYRKIRMMLITSLIASTSYGQLIVNDLRTFSTPNPSENPEDVRWMPQGIVQMNLKELFGLPAEEGFKLEIIQQGTPYTANSEPDVSSSTGMAKLKIWNYDPTDTDDTDGDPKGAGTLIYAIFSDVTSTGAFTFKTWNIQKSTEGIGNGVHTFPNKDYASNKIKQSITSALYYPDEYSEQGEYQTSECTPNNTLFTTWNWWDIIANKKNDFTNRTECGIWANQPVIISLEAKNVRIDSVAIPGLGKLPGEYFDMQVRKKELKNYREDYTMVLAHRSFWKDHPENSGAAITAAINETDADIIEFDLYLTKDDKIVAMHDAFVDRLIEGLSGWTSDYDLSELQSYNLRDRLGNVTTERLLSLSEALGLAKGKSLVYLDTKFDPNPSKQEGGRSPKVWQAAFEVVRDKGMLGQVIFTGYEDYATLMSNSPEFVRGNLLNFPIHGTVTDPDSYLNDTRRTTGFVTRIFNDSFTDELSFANQVINAGFRFYYFSNLAQYWHPDQFAFRDKPIFVQFETELDRRGDFDWMLTNKPGIFIADRVDNVIPFLKALGKRTK